MSMLYIKVSFWMGVVTIAFKVLAMCWSDYPRVVKWSVGEDAVSLLITGLFTVWAWSLIYH